MHATGSRSHYWQYFLSSFVLILAVRYASSSDSVAPVEGLLDLCQSSDQPNPIASTYPTNATGTLNGTISILPIPLAMARKLIPSQYRILEHAYRSLLPTFPQDMYPAVLQALHDHDVQASGFKIPDFSRAGIEFPFVDLLGDNSTSFKWVPSLLMTASNAMALSGAVAYGTNTFPANFDPSCDAYRNEPDAKEPDSTTFGAKSLEDGAASVTTLFATTVEEVYPLRFFKNITNQPMFADGKTCDNMIRLFDTSVTTAPNKIDIVKGTVKAKIFPFDSEQEWGNVYGLRLGTAFIENNYLPCENFRGYGGSSE